MPRVMIVRCHTAQTIVSCRTSPPDLQPVTVIADRADGLERLLPDALLLQAAIGPVGASDVLAWLSFGRQLSESGSGEPLPPSPPPPAP